jgi:hypothetical protein
MREISDLGGHAVELLQNDESVGCDILLVVGGASPIEKNAKGDLGAAGFSSLRGYESARLISTAGLTHFEDVAFLNGAKTAEPFHRRGAQVALIAARVDEARRVGCTLIVTETLTRSQTSYVPGLKWPMRGKFTGV